MFCHLQIYLHSEAIVRRCSVKKVFLEISQNSQESTCVRDSFLIKLQALLANIIKRESLTQVFSCEFWEISKNNFFTEHLRRLLLYIFALMNEIKSLAKTLKYIGPWLKSCKTAIDVPTIFFFFFYQGFLSRTLTTHRTAGEGRGPFSIPLFHSRTFRHLCATLHVR